MKKYQKICLFLILVIFSSQAFSQSLDDFSYAGTGNPELNPVINSFQFNGYTNYWHNSFSNWYRYGNLYKMAVPQVEKTILQSKVDIAEDMGVPGLIMQEGFLDGLLADPYKVLKEPGLSILGATLTTENVLVFVDPNSETGKQVSPTSPSDNVFLKNLNSFQYNASNLKRVEAYYLEAGERKLFVISSSDKKTREKLERLIDNAKEVFGKYDMHKGWFGAYSLLKSVTITAGHPLEIIGKGMNEGNSWFVFDGYMDFLAKDELENWMAQVKLPVITDVGFPPIYGCTDYNGFQNQSLFTKESWINYARKKEGYVFRNVWDKKANPYQYDGYFASEGNKEQIDNVDVPFVLKTGKIEDHALSSMVLFLEKGKSLTRESMWETILNRQEVGILPRGKMLGPAMFRNSLQMLLLDRVYIEEYFGDRIDMEAVVEGYDLKVTVTNSYPNEFEGSLAITLPTQLEIEDPGTIDIRLHAKTQRTYTFKIQPKSSALGKTNPIAVDCIWRGNKKSTVAMLDLPPVISAQQLLYGHSPQINFPVTIHNFLKETNFPVKVKVVQQNTPNEVVLESEKQYTAAQGTHQDDSFKLNLPPGGYKVIVTALGTESISQLGVGKTEGKTHLTTVDMNGDGIYEYQMENDSVKVSLITTGARVIEYIVKSRDDNIFFKLWPEKTIDHKRPFRERGFYPYGGFEDFLGQGSMETHTNYDAEIERKEGDYVRVRMWTDYFGNRLEKTFTLYGDSPLLEVRFALTFINPYANVLGPQPILELGKRHWTEDVYTIPELDGLHEYRMRPEKRYGLIFHVKEGWNAGYDPMEDVAFVGAFPVSQPLFLHMFLNDPGNRSSHHYYAEFQPWVPIFQKSTMYFSYYIWGAGGPWENGLEELRKMNLITTR